ncbi:MAG: CopD family protein [Chloroflexi bacterium]|nr:CopD family protein [Chloroflexota bacterium]
MSQVALAISLFFHILATVVWIGGILLITFLVVPQVNDVLEEHPALHQLLLRIRKRFAHVSNLALAALVVTGLLQMTADPNYDGMLRLDNQWSRVLLLKHLLIVVMAILGLSLQWGLAPALERASMLVQREKGHDHEWRRLRRKERQLSVMIALLAVSILATSAWLVSI